MRWFCSIQDGVTSKTPRLYIRDWDEAVGDIEMLHMFMSSPKWSNGDATKTWKVQTNSSGLTDVLIVYEDSRGAIFINISTFISRFW